MALKINIRRWRELTPAVYYRNWHEKANKVNSDIGDLCTYHDSAHMWSTYRRRRPYAVFRFGFNIRGDFCSEVIAGNYKDPQKKIFSAKEVEEIVQSVLNAVNAFSDAGILEEC